MKDSVLCDGYLVLVLGLLNNYPIPGDLTWIKTYNHVMLSNPKNISNLPFYVDILNGIFTILTEKEKKPDKMRMSLSCTAWLGHQQKILNTTPLVISNQRQKHNLILYCLMDR